MRYVVVSEGKVVGVVNYDGQGEHPYGAVDLRGPVPEDATLEQLMGQRVYGNGPFEPAMGGGFFTPPQTAEEAIARERADGDADPEGTAQLNYPHLFEAAPTPDTMSSEENAEGAQPLTAAQLLESSNMPWFAFKSEAKRILGARILGSPILGDAMPDKKEDIIAALKRVAAGNPE